MKKYIVPVFVFLAGIFSLSATPVYSPASVGYAETSGTSSFATSSGSAAISGSALLSGTASWATSSGAATTSATAGALTSTAATAFATAAQGLSADSARQPQPALKNVQAALSGTGVLRVALLGDSFVANASTIYRDQLARLFGSVAGYGLGMNYAVLSGGATQNIVDYASSPTGISYAIPSGGVATFGGFDLGGTVGTVCTAWKIFYKTTPASGAFRIETLNSSGSVTGTTSVTATGASTYGSVVSGNIGWGLNKIRVTGVSGTCTILGCEMVDTYRLGGIIFEGFAIGGLALSNMVATPAEVLSPVVAGMAPDVYVYCMNDDASAISTYLPTVISKLTAGYAASDFIFVGSHPNFQITDGVTSDAINAVANAALKNIAKNNHSQWIDSYSLFGGSISVCNAAGLLDSGTVHLTTTGEGLKTAAVIEQSGLTGLALATKYRTPVFSQLAVPGILNDSSRLGGDYYVGRDDPRGYRASAFWFNDSASSSFVDGGGSYKVENVSGTFQISKNTWLDNSRGNLRLFSWKGQPAVNVPQGAALVLGGTSAASTLPCITGGTGAPPATMVSGSSWSNNAMYVQTDATGPAWWVYQGGWKLLQSSGLKVVSSGTYTVLPSDDIIGVTGSGVEIKFPAGFPAGKRVLVKVQAPDLTGILLTGTFQYMDGTIGMGSYMSQQLYTDGTSWFAY